MSREYPRSFRSEAGSMMRFSGAQPISIERRHFDIIRTHRYRVCEKTDGIRHFLIKESDGDPYIINRALVKTNVRIRIPKNTYLDGELMGDCFVVYDAMMIDGHDLCDMNLIDRVAAAEKLINKIPIVRGAFKLKLKNHVELSKMSTLNPYADGNDGLILTPVDEPIRTGTHETLFKWKPFEHNTVDFMYDRDGYLCIQSGAVSRATFEGRIGSIIECRFEKGVWIPVKVRTDKTYPNNRRTYERTLVNIREDIKFTELIQLGKDALRT
jgi:hypothetical protein